MATRRMGIRELRDNLTATIRRVRAGETIEITYRDRPVAVIAPILPDRIEQLLAAGDVTPATPLERPLRRVPATGKLTASEALAQDRAER